MSYGGPVVLDMSAWARVLLGRLGDADRARFEAAARSDQVVVCEPFLIEALYSTQSPLDYRRLAEELGALPQASTPPGVLAAALAAQAAMAEVRGVSHRVKAIDLMVAVIADHHGLGVLHYDHDYDLIAAHAGLHCPSVWIAGRGTMT